MVEISASLLAADYARLGDEVRRAEKAGVSSFHFDLMDGQYAANLALAPQHLKALRPFTRLPFHAHLELANPDRVLEAFDLSEADLIIVQCDTLPWPTKTFERIRALNAGVGLCLNPSHPIRMAQEYLAELDCLLMLGVHPGFGGQSMQSGVLEKLAQARRIIDESDYDIKLAVDGGIHPGNAASLIRAGADCLIMGTALFQPAGMEEVVQKIQTYTSSLLCNADI
jgi:ribulose-phosphate 3-epimerase